RPATPRTADGDGCSLRARNAGMEWPWAPSAPVKSLAGQRPKAMAIANVMANRTPHPDPHVALYQIKHPSVRAGERGRWAAGIRTHPLWSSHMIEGAHFVIYSSDPDADRAFFRDVLALPNVDVGGGWLIFGLPPAEVAFHPAESSG